METREWTDIPVESVEIEDDLEFFLEWSRFFWNEKSVQDIARALGNGNCTLDWNGALTWNGVKWISTNLGLTLAFLKNDPCSDALPPFLFGILDPNLASGFGEEIHDLRFTERVGSPEHRVKLALAIDDLFEIVRGI
jgi:hypothetical protein